MDIKKVEISMKNPENYPIKGFAQVKKIITHIFQKRALHWLFYAPFWVVQGDFHGDQDFFDL